MYLCVVFIFMLFMLVVAFIELLEMYISKQRLSINCGFHIDYIQVIYIFSCGSLCKTGHKAMGVSYILQRISESRCITIRFDYVMSEDFGSFIQFFEF